MSILHIKQELIELTPAARREVEQFLVELRATEQQSDTPVATRKLSHEEAMDYVFKGFAPALAKLAQ